MLITSRLRHGRAAVCIGLHPAADTGITADTLFRSASDVPVLEYGDCLVHTVLYCLSLVSYIVITLSCDIECSATAPVRLLPLAYSNCSSLFAVILPDAPCRKDVPWLSDHRNTLRTGSGWTTSTGSVCRYNLCKSRNMSGGFSLAIR